ncbi:MAG TPA: substrate-binding domain-containing protein [Chloroflexia bacterium]
MKAFTDWLGRRWARSLSVKLEVLLIVSTLGPVGVLLLLLWLTGSLWSALLGLVVMQGVVLILGRRAIIWLIRPLRELTTRLRLTAAGDLRHRLPTNTATAQAAALQGFVAQRVDAILLAAVDDQSLVPAAQAAHRAGIPVIAVDSRLAEAQATNAVVMTDNHGGGRMAGEALIRLLDGQGQVAVVGLSPHQSHGRAREAGFREALAAAPGVDIVTVQYAFGDKALGRRLTEDILRTYPALAAIYAVNEGAACGVLMALRGHAPRERRVRVVAWDAAPEELQALESGLLDALIVQNAWMLGYCAIDTALAVIEGRAGPPVVHLATRLIRQADLASPEVRAWLSGAPPTGHTPPPRAPVQLYRIGFARKGRGAVFWEQVTAGAVAAARDCGVRLLYHDSAEGDADELGALAETFNQRIDSIRSLVLRLQQEAGVIGPRAQELVQSAAGQAALAREQTAALERLSHGVDRMSLAAQQIVAGTEAVAESAAGTLRGVTQAEVAVNDSSQRLQAIVERLTESLNLLSGRSEQVTSGADAMSDIADETHLLSLNATIEAAGAGAYGQRFAVVAEAVRELAGQALNTTQEFQSIAEEMRVAARAALAATQDSERGTDLSMDLALQARDAIQGIAGLAQHTSDAVQAITRAVAEQQDTNTELAGFAGQVTATAREAATASAALSQVAQDLTAVVARLQESVAAFHIAETGSPGAQPAGGPERRSAPNPSVARV